MRKNRPRQRHRSRAVADEGCGESVERDIMKLWQCSKVCTFLGASEEFQTYAVKAGDDDDDATIWRKPVALAEESE